MAAWPYSTQRWQRLRRLKLAEQPICERCITQGRVEAATDVDHRRPISQGGDPFPPLDQLNSFCHSCHSTKTNEDMTGKVKGCDVDGWPLDPDHAWSSGEGSRRR